MPKLSKKMIKMWMPIRKKILLLKPLPLKLQNRSTSVWNNLKGKKSNFSNSGMTVASSRASQWSANWKSKIGRSKFSMKKGRGKREKQLEKKFRNKNQGRTGVKSFVQVKIHNHFYSLGFYNWTIFTFSLLYRVIWPSNTTFSVTLTNIQYFNKFLAFWKYHIFLSHMTILSYFDALTYFLPNCCTGKAKLQLFL